MKDQDGEICPPARRPWRDTLKTHLGMRRRWQKREMVFCGGKNAEKDIPFYSYLYLYGKMDR
jgi:hypothetical protein